MVVRSAVVFTACVVALVVCGTALAVVFLDISATNSSTSNVFDALQLGLRRKVGAQINQILGPIDAFLAIASKRTARGSLRLSGNMSKTAAGSMFASQCARTTLTSCYFGRADGGFYLVNQEAPTSLIYSAHTPGIMYQETIPLANFSAYLRGDPSAIVLVDDHSIAYDPRKRPWYIESGPPGTVSWTKPYVFPATTLAKESIGITATAVVDFPPGAAADGVVTSRTVLAVDFSTESLVSVVASLLPTAGSFGALVVSSASGDGSRYVLASTDPVACPPALLTDGKVQPQPLGTCPVAAAGVAMGGDGVTTTGSYYVITQSAAGGMWGKGALQAAFVVILGVPRRDLTGPAETSRNRGVVIACCVGAAAAVVGSLVLWAVVLLPVARLSGAMSRVADMDIQDDDCVYPRPSHPAVWVAETAAMRGAFAAMATSLRAYKKFVPESLFVAPGAAQCDDATARHSGTSPRTRSSSVSSPHPSGAGHHATSVPSEPPGAVGAASGSVREEGSVPTHMHHGGGMAPWMLVRLAAGAGKQWVDKVDSRVQETCASVLCVRLVGCADADGGAVPLNAEVLDRVVAAVREDRGVVECVVGDDVVATFGLHARITHHSTAAAACASRIRERTRGAEGVAMAVATSSLVARFASLNAEKGGGGVMLAVSGQAVRVARALVAVASVGQVLLHSSAAAAAIGAKTQPLLPGVVALTAMAGDGTVVAEWMYELAAVEIPADMPSSVGTASLSPEALALLGKVVGVTPRG